MASRSSSRILAIAVFVIVPLFVAAQDFGDQPAIKKHLNQRDIETGRMTLPDVIDAGEHLFIAEFNRLDGVAMRTNANFNRIIGPDTQSCADCHFKPVIGGAGPNAANVFAVPSDPSRLDLTDPRNSNHLFGAGALELLGIEMSQKLLALERNARAEAKANGKPVTVKLTVKGVEFGELTVLPDGTSDKTKVVGIDRNLILKPFSRKGIVRTIRQFSLNASNLHFGIQAVEVAGDFVDASGDGMVNKLTVGDITALTAWQANLPIPIRAATAEPRRAAAIRNGEAGFSEIGCAVCHLPTLRLERPVFRLNDPRDNEGRLVTLDLTTQSRFPRLPRNADGSADVPLFSDLKRHDMGEGLAETFVQTGVGRTVFITTPLWGTGNTGPWLHDGRATTLHDAIVLHGGEADVSRRAYLALPDERRREIVEFLKSLVLPVPENSPDRKTDAAGKSVGQVPKK